jgi:hypothetical protein
MKKSTGLRPSKITQKLHVRNKTVGLSYGRLQTNMLSRRPIGSGQKKLARNIIYNMLLDANRRYLTLLNATRRYSTQLDATIDATRRYLTLLDATRRYSTLLDATRGD